MGVFYRLLPPSGIDGGQWELPRPSPLWGLQIRASPTLSASDPSARASSSALCWFGPA